MMDKMLERLNPPCVIKVDGSVEPISVSGKYLKLEEMQKAVEGLIEFVYIGNKKYAIIVNEEGLVYNLKPNVFARLNWGKILVGNILIVPKRMLK